MTLLGATAVNTSSSPLYDGLIGLSSGHLSSYNSMSVVNSLYTAGIIYSPIFSLSYQNASG